MDGAVLSESAIPAWCKVKRDDPQRLKDFYVLHIAADRACDVSRFSVGEVNKSEMALDLAVRSGSIKIVSMKQELIVVDPLDPLERVARQDINVR